MSTFDQAQATRLGQRLESDNTVVLMFAGSEIPESPWHGMMIYRTDLQVLQIYRSSLHGGSDAFEDVVAGTPTVLTFIGPNPPVPVNIGDLWIETDQGNLLHRWDGSAWISVQWNTTAIADNAITFSKIQAQAIDGKIITGATLQTAASGPNRVYINSSGLVGVNGSGGVGVNIPTNGFLSADNATMYDLWIVSDQNPGLYGLFSFTPSLTEFDLDTNGHFYLDAAGTVKLNSGPGSGQWFYTNWSATPSLNLQPDGDVVIPRHGTTTNGANAFINSGSGALRRSTSRRDMKLAIEPMAKEDVEGLLDVQLSSWYDKGDSEALADYLAGETEELADTTPLRRIPGLIAEDVEEAGLDQFVFYGDEGRVEGLMYDRIGVAWIPLVKDLVARVEALEARVAELEGSSE